MKSQIIVFNQKIADKWSIILIRALLLIFVVFGLWLIKKAFIIEKN